MRKAAIKILTDVESTSSIDNIQVVASQHGSRDSTSHVDSQGFGSKTLVLEGNSEITGEDVKDSLKTVSSPSSRIACSTVKVLGEGFQSTGKGSQDHTEKLSGDDDAGSMTACKMIVSVRARLATVRCNLY